ncbi:MAG TPA: sugar phosphate isomerase/epimerase [Spirochaetia bacterium]|nr:sugar phosphate isomerase/epimerase [Spirochaetia bacterium]
MKLGVFAALFRDKSLEETLDYIASVGVQAVEIAAGGYVGNAHCKPAELLKDEKKVQEFRKAIESRGLEISALSCHGNPLHPEPKQRAQFHADFENAVELASRIGVKTVVTFSGCPGDSDNSKYPSWIVCPWPNDFSTVVAWQWKEKVIPYWVEQNRLLEKRGVRVAIEPHPGFVVYNTETMLRLRAECGETIGANFDPSHLFWQQMNPAECIKELGKARALFHFHAKDTGFDGPNVRLNGVLDTKSYAQIPDRSWVFRTVGYGHGEQVWREIIGALQLIGYNGSVSIEHEDGLMSKTEGFEKAVAFLKGMVINEPAGEMWWI